MPEALDDDVVQFLLHNPPELALIRRKIEAGREKAQREQLKAMEPPRPVKMVPCGTYGCTQPKPEGAIFCESCYQDYKEDPDAYK
jgi:hypothetical protein